MLYKFGSNLNLKTHGNSVITVNSVHRLSYMADDLLRRSKRVVAVFGVALAWGRAPAWLLLASWPSYKDYTVAVLRFLFLCFFPSPPLLLRRAFAVDLALLPSQQRLFQLRLLLAHPAILLGLPDFAGLRRSSSSSSLSVAPSSRVCCRGQSSMVHLCPCVWLLQFRLDAVVLNTLLIARFDHRSHRSAATDDRCSAVGAVHVELLLRGSSGLALCSVAFGVSSWFFRVVCVMSWFFQVVCAIS